MPYRGHTSLPALIHAYIHAYIHTYIHTGIIVECLIVGILLYLIESASFGAEKSDLAGTIIHRECVSVLIPLSYIDPHSARMFFITQYCIVPSQMIYIHTYIHTERMIFTTQ